MKPSRANMRWTQVEDTALRMEWGDAVPSTIARKLGRTVFSVVIRAVRIGLQRGIPRGYVSVTEASRIGGYNQADTMKIFERYGVTMREWRTRNSCTRKNKWKFVDRDAALRAFESFAEWISQTSTPDQIKAHGPAKKTIKRRAAFLGFQGVEWGHTVRYTQEQAQAILSCDIRSRWRVAA